MLYVAIDSEVSGVSDDACESQFLQLLQAKVKFFVRVSHVACGSKNL